MKDYEDIVNSLNKATMKLTKAGDQKTAETVMTAMAVMEQQQYELSKLRRLLLAQVY